MKKLLNRLKEPSSWAGLSVLAAIIGVPLLPEQLAAIANAGAAIAAAVAMLLPESK